MVRRLQRFAVAGTMLIAMLAAAPAQAALNGFGLQLSSFSPDDELTEDLFGLDDGPVPQFFYRFQGNAHGLFVGFGFAEWERDDASVVSRIDFVPVFANYRYIPWHDKPVSLVVGAGLGYAFYDAEIDVPGAFYYETQTGLFVTAEPLIGIEFRASKNIRFNLDYEYSFQLLTTEDLEGLDNFTEIDMSGGYATFGISFLFGD